MGIILFVLSVVLFIPISIIGFIWGIIEAFWKRKFKGGVSRIDNYFLTLAISIDMVGNVVAKELLNDTLIKESGYKFGAAGETISSVLGKNLQQGTLTQAGMILNNILNSVDENHSLNSINDCI